jgi:hypothetical protein
VRRVGRGRRVENGLLHGIHPGRSGHAGREPFVRGEPPYPPTGGHRGGRLRFSGRTGQLWGHAAYIVTARTRESWVKTTYIPSLVHVNAVPEFVLDRQTRRTVVVRRIVTIFSRPSVVGRVASVSTSRDTSGDGCRLMGECRNWVHLTLVRCAVRCESRCR